MPIDTLDNRRLTIKGYETVKHAKNQKETKSKYIFYTDLVMKKMFLHTKQYYKLFAKKK